MFKSSELWRVLYYITSVTLLLSQVYYSSEWVINQSPITDGDVESGVLYRQSLLDLAWIWTGDLTNLERILYHCAIQV